MLELFSREKLLESGTHLVFPKDRSEGNLISLVVVRKGYLLEAALRLEGEWIICPSGEREDNLVTGCRRYKMSALDSKNRKPDSAYLE